MHDAGECYCVDVPRPLKYLAGMEAYRAHEKRVMKAICKWFNMDPVEPPSVKVADNIMLVTEQRDLLKNSIPDFDITPLADTIFPWDSIFAKYAFISRFNQLTERTTPSNVNSTEHLDPGQGWFPGRTDRT
jgi:5'-deoxynucleotidase YfbR-like HD superfamily hydrolase